ncbi:MAG: hypothetical protein OEY59_00335 [Deltaproteobacteria bacterium]|nr:hypothetical protein [Deltaproteobacteria bacterium]
MNLKNIKDFDLIKLYGNLIQELKDREIIRSKNVIGDLGEYLAIEYYNKTSGLPNLQFAPTGTQNIDAISRNGERYSIKSSTTNLTGVFYGLPNNESDEKPIQKFEYVIIVKFDDNYNLTGIYELNWNQFLDLKKWHSRMKAWNISITKKVIKLSKIIFEINSEGSNI